MFKLQYLLYGMLQRYDSCVTLKPIHYHLVSDFNTDPSILQTHI
jgi:hypothetical protein